MERQDLVKTLAARTGLAPMQVEAVLRALAEMAGQALAAGERVDVPGLGMFLPHESVSLIESAQTDTVGITDVSPVLFQPDSALSDLLVGRPTTGPIPERPGRPAGESGPKPHLGDPTTPPYPGRRPFRGE